MNMRHRRLNGWRRLALMPVLLLAVLMLVLAGSLAFRGTAHAQSGNTATATFTIASTAKLIARTTLQMSVTASCTLPVGATLFESNGSMTISQASGRQIVQAFNQFAPPTCDGTAYTFQVFFTPPAGSAPFHGGRAIAIGGISIFYTDASGNNNFVSAGVSNQTISIKG
jgi:hypothetical protein